MRVWSPRDQTRTIFPLRPVSPYGIAKLAVEQELKVSKEMFDMDYIIFRPHNVYGERQNPHGEAGVVDLFLKLLYENQKAVINGDGLQTRDYVHVSDVVHANMAVVGLEGFHIFNVGTGVETTVVDLYRGLRIAAGSQLEAAHGPAKPGEQRRSCVDANRLRNELGWPEPLALQDGLQRTADWFRDNA